MAWVQGTCNGHLELLDALKTFLTTNAELIAAGQNWSVSKDQTVAPYTHKIGGSYTGSFRELYLVGPGLSGTDAIHVAIRAYQTTNTGAFNWLINGHLSYDPIALFEDQPGSCVNNTQAYAQNFFVALTNSTIEYWFVANGRRMMVIAKINGDFYGFYAGLILPYALPTEFPYPLFISGNYHMVDVIPSIGGNTNWWGHATNGLAALRDLSGIWLGMYGPQQTIPTTYLQLWPEDEGVSGYGFPVPLIGSPDGTLPLLPHILYTAYGSKACFGELDGSFCVPGLSMVAPSVASEDTITIGSDTYLVVQNCDKTTRSSYAAIKLA